MPTFQLPDGWECTDWSDRSIGTRTAQGVWIRRRYNEKNYPSGSYDGLVMIYETDTNPPEFYIARNGYANLYNKRPPLAGPFESFELAYVTYKVGNYGNATR